MPTSDSSNLHTDASLTADSANGHHEHRDSSEYPPAPRASDGSSGPSAAGASPNGVADGLPSASELEQTLQRLVRRMAMLIQAEKCIFLLHDRERHQLVARPPALGFTPEEIKSMRVSTTQGVSGTVFTTGQPMMVADVQSNDLIDKTWAKKLDVRNVISHPLVREMRDEQERVTGKHTVGVLHVINKRGGAEFTDEDVRLLSIMSRQVTAVIANAQLYLKLTEEKEQLQATLQSLLTGIFMVETTGHVSLINPAARHMFGLDDLHLSGQQYWEIIPIEEVTDLVRKAVEDGVEGQAEIEIEVASSTVDGPRIFQLQTAIVRGEHNGLVTVMGVVAIFNDITEIRNVERMKTAFVSTVSHELRTPLTSIKGFVSTLLQDTEGYYDAETRMEFYGIIDSECDRLQRLIEDLLNVSRIESGRALQMHWTTFEPVAIIEKVMNAQRSYTDKHELILESPDEVPHVLGDADKFDQMMTNLISNAIKYAPSGGQIRMNVSVGEESLRVSVADQGIGIPADKLGRIFEKFERVDDRDTRQAGGTGIGLYLVKHLVERHEGKIWVESEVGKGSTFIFEIPMRPQKALDEMAELGQN
ncbi:MAG TPA: ATP-binding protein [Abditibacteriaceae bacterium]|jgi:two-component system phosphate regulon sensor histidine kinase PhoR